MSVTEEIPATSSSARAVVSVPVYSERMAAGKLLRQSVPRSSHDGWSPPANRPDAIDLLQSQNQSRLPDLVPVRFGRMLASPFSFFRGSAILMANDLASTPVSGPLVQACGDAHISNFGTYATPERSLVFDLNDFDETLPAPWEWDVKRLVASVVVASQGNGYRGLDVTRAAEAAVRSYRERMNLYASMSHLDVWYTRIQTSEIEAVVSGSARRDLSRGLQRASQRGNLQALDKMTTVVDGRIRIKDEPPLIVHHSDELVGDRLPEFAKGYRTSINPELRALLTRYTFVDFAQKVVGVGSVGTRCYIVLLEGNHDRDPLFLQIKEAVSSVLEPFAGKTKFKNHGERVVNGQRATQAASDIFLGWGRVNGIDFYARQLRDMKGSFVVEQLSARRMAIYAGLCGWALARAHARTGDAATIAGYLGTGDTFDEAVVGFAKDYADQNARDYNALVAAVKAGRVEATTGL